MMEIVYLIVRLALSYRARKVRGDTTFCMSSGDEESSETQNCTRRHDVSILTYLILIACIIFQVPVNMEV